MAALGQLAIGGGQMIASQISKRKRPKYEIPEGERQALALAKLRAADTTMPGEQIAADRAALTQANSIRASQEGGNALEALPGITAATQSAMGDISARSEAVRAQNLDSLEGALSRRAEYEDQKFQMNEYAPFAQSQQMKAQQFGAGMQNIMGGLDKYGLGQYLSQSPSNLGSTSSGGNYGQQDINTMMMMMKLLGGNKLPNLLP